MRESRHTFRASLVREGRWVVAQCLDVDVASQGRTETEALRNLREALELHFEEPVATEAPILRNVRALVA